MQPLLDRWALIEAALAEAEEALLSARKALLVAALLDDFCDRAFAALRHQGPEAVLGAEDVLAFRARLREAEPAFADLFALCALRPDGPRLVTRAVEVPIADYPQLSVQDFMVSLYNRNTVQRVLLAWPDGSTREMHPLLRRAVGWWRRRLTNPAP